MTTNQEPKRLPILTIVPVNNGFIAEVGDSRAMGGYSENRLVFRSVEELQEAIPAIYALPKVTEIKITHEPYNHTT